MAFVLDLSSGDLDLIYRVSLPFIRQVAEGLPLKPDRTRSSFVTAVGQPTTQFYFNTYRYVHALRPVHTFPKQAILFPKTKSPVSGDKGAVSGNKSPETETKSPVLGTKLPVWKQNRRFRKVWTGLYGTGSVSTPSTTGSLQCCS